LIELRRWNTMKAIVTIPSVARGLVASAFGFFPAAMARPAMSYYFSKTIAMPFAQAIHQVTDALAAKGFGVLTTIDVRATMKEKLDVDFRPYTILGACNPEFAHKALLSEDKIGTMLPCNVVVQEAGSGEIEVSAVDPVASMSAVGNASLAGIANEVRERLRQVVAGL
jgi:uncharacterized protein (DUF302 family)